MADVVMVHAVLASLSEGERAMVRRAVKRFRARKVIEEPPAKGDSSVRKATRESFGVAFDGIEIELPPQLLSLVATLAELLEVDAVPMVATTRKGVAALRKSSRGRSLREAGTRASARGRHPPR